jgi:hypothetical protein
MSFETDSKRAWRIALVCPTDRIGEKMLAIILQREMTRMALNRHHTMSVLRSLSGEEQT